MAHETPKLNWFEMSNGFAIAWEWEAGPGTFLGEDGGSEHEAATEAATRIGKPTQPIPGGPMLWGTQGAVKRALKAAKAAVNTFRAGIPSPDWALKAYAEGWTPPKGWTPKPNDDLKSPEAEEFNRAYLRKQVEGWDAAATLMAASGPPHEELADFCRKKAAELRAILTASPDAWQLPEGWSWRFRYDGSSYALGPRAGDLCLWNGQLQAYGAPAVVRDLVRRRNQTLTHILASS